MADTAGDGENRAGAAVAKSERTCCGDLPLSTGCLAIGAVLLVLNAVVVVRQAVVLASSDTSENAALAVLPLCAAAIAMVFNGLLIYGVKWHNRCAILWWLIYHGISYAVASIACAYAFVVACIASGSIVPFLVLMLGIWTMAVLWYWFHTVRLYYHELTLAT